MNIFVDRRVHALGAIQDDNLHQGFRKEVTWDLKQPLERRRLLSKSIACLFTIGMCLCLSKDC